jgi:3-phenylpropionate/cinnamic acid dioxygenase small subunit
MLGDGDRIRNLLGRYCDLLDAAAWDELGALFAGGALASEEGVVLATGAEEVASFYRRGTKLDEAGSPRTKHLVTNTQLAADGDDRVVARSSYLVLQDLVPIITGRYVDTFVRVDGGDGWSWRERRFAVDQVGDLSEHLTWSPPT